jgi:hypothetical protein
VMTSSGTAWAVYLRMLLRERMACMASMFFLLCGVDSL